MAKGRERTTKWYFKNEAEVMKELGLKPAKGSGSGWVEKEDGSNDYVIAQLKSTDKESYKLNQIDLQKLEYNALVSSKIPLFLLQFLNNDSRYAIVKLEDIPLLAKYIETGHVEIKETVIELEDEPKQKQHVKKIGSSAKAREKFFKDKEESWNKRKRR